MRLVVRKPDVNTEVMRSAGLFFLDSYGACNTMTERLASGLQVGKDRDQE